MGIYYQPPPPNIGGQQPLTPEPLIPQSGPTPSNPIFGAVSLAATLVAAWTATAAPLPQTAPQLIPPAIIGPPPARLPFDVLQSWAVLPPVPPTSHLLNPPISGPTPQAPPISGGASVGEAVLVQWLPPPPYPPQAVNLDPPIAGPAPQNPPFRGGARAPDATFVQWIPPPPNPPQAVNLDPPIAGPAPQNPPFATGAAIPEAVLVGWLPPPPQPLVAINLDPPIAGPTPQNPPRLVVQRIDWGAPEYALPGRPFLAPLLAPAPISGPPVGYRPGMVEIQVWWSALQQMPAFAGMLIPPSPALTFERVHGMTHYDAPSSPGQDTRKPGLI